MYPGSKNIKLIFRAKNIFTCFLFYIKVTGKLLSDYTYNQYYNLPLKNNFFNGSVAFSSNSFLKQTSEEITSIVLNSLLKENKIGFGSEGTVYKIPGTKYCVKIMKDSDSRNFGNWLFNLTKQEKLNHIVAKSQNGTVIMALLSGKPLSWHIPEEIYNLPQ